MSSRPPRPEHKKPDLNTADFKYKKPEANKLDATIKLVGKFATVKLHSPTAVDFFWERILANKLKMVSDTIIIEANMVTLTLSEMRKAGLKVFLR